MQPSRNFDDLKFSSIHRRILLWGSGGPFLDGYVLVMIGVALEQLTPALKLDADWIGLLGAGTLAGLFVGTSLFGYISDKVGRRKMFLIDIIAIGVISVATMFVSSPVELLVMRVLIGIVIGADYPIATSMITEFSSTRQRAFSISFIAAMWYVGATCADLVGYWLYDVEGGWRWMLGSAAIPCLLILIGRFELPESPRWLLRKGRVKECEEMMIKLFGEPVAFEEEQPQQTRFRDLFNRRHFPFVLFVAAIWTCQVIPMFAIYTFGPQIVGLLGLGVGKNAALGNVVISLFFMLGCIPPMLWLNTAGRRPLLIGSFAMMTLALASRGASVFCETIFENRFMHARELVRLGAQIRIEDRIALVEGGHPLQGAAVSSTDLRGGAALMLAGLLAQTCENLLEQGITPDVYYNGHLAYERDDVKKHNDALVDKYYRRMRNL